MRNRPLLPDLPLSRLVAPREQDGRPLRIKDKQDPDHHPAGTQLFQVVTVELPL